jgi:hypothetical protein
MPPLFSHVPPLSVCPVGVGHDPWFTRTPTPHPLANTQGVQCPHAPLLLCGSRPLPPFSLFAMCTCEQGAGSAPPPLSTHLHGTEVQEGVCCPHGASVSLHMVACNELAGQQKHGGTQLGGGERGGSPPSFPCNLPPSLCLPLLLAHEGGLHAVLAAARQPPSSPVCTLRRHANEGQCRNGKLHAPLLSAASWGAGGTTRPYPLCLDSTAHPLLSGCVTTPSCAPPPVCM